MTDASNMSDRDSQTSRAGRLRLAAAVLFFSGALIGVTLGRASIWLLPSQVARPSPVGQVSRALEPPDIVRTQAAEKAAAKEKARAEGRLPETAATPSERNENAGSGKAETERLSVAPTNPGPVTNEGKPEAAPVAQQPAPPAPTITLLNPGAVQESTNERPTQGARAAKNKAAAQDEPSARRKRDRRAASTDDDVGATGRERGSRSDYRSLREEMLRR
jgi:hypothetical protein